MSRIVFISSTDFHGFGKDKVKFMCIREGKNNSVYEYQVDGAIRNIISDCAIHTPGKAFNLAKKFGELIK